MEITVTVKGATATWDNPKALLCRHFEFFRAACNGLVKESKQSKSKMELRECNPRKFERFVQFIYLGTIPPGLHMTDYVYVGFRLWALGNRLLAQYFENSVICASFELHSPTESEAAAI
jgi:hypothetical protein